MFLYQQCSVATANYGQRLVAAAISNHFRKIRLSERPSAGANLKLTELTAQRRRRQHGDGNSNSSWSTWRFPWHPGAGVLLAGWGIKQFLGLDIRRDQLDEDPLKDRVKWAMLHRQRGHWDQALEVLNTALQEAMATGNDLFVTRMYYELAITYMQSDQLDNAEQLFLLLHNRYITLHRATGSSPEIIANSLKLADILARKGKLEDAETAYKFCLGRQIEVLEKHLASHHVSKGADIETRLPIETRGPTYTDPIALFGMVLEDYAHFLVEYYPDTRMDEAEEYIKEALKTSYQIFGVNSFHSLNMLGIFAAKCVLKNKFETARNFLEIGINRVAMVPEAESVDNQNAQ